MGDGCLCFLFLLPILLNLVVPTEVCLQQKTEMKGISEFYISSTISSTVANTLDISTF